ncbi:MAG: response regulator [Candidatus Magasanikbacteria bacterium]|nr:response regulator [Candidatus Magasanikbacteria bacterium]
MTKKINKKSHRILLVEDEKPLARVVRDRLEESGFEVDMTHNAQQALKSIKKHPDTDLVWLDHYLIGHDDGLGFLEKMNTIRDKNTPAVFVVSNSNSDEDIKKYKKLNIKKYYTKINHGLDEIINDVKKELNLYERAKNTDCRG